jgi:Transcriptional regulatory protein, C terminal/AAA ATPase domain
LFITSVTKQRTPFVGRTAELRALDDLLTGRARIIHLHGIAGIGKSALVHTFVEHAQEAGATVLELDCRAIEPTTRGLREAIVPGGDDQALIDHFEKLVPPVVLVLDHYELFRLMDTWLRQVLLPELSGSVTMLLAGRERPVAGWFPVTGFRSLPLGPLPEGEARTLLERLGVADRDVARLNHIARGHPLALILASAGMTEHPDLALEDAAATGVVAELTRLYLADIEDPAARQSLEAASVVRRVTEPLLASMLEHSDVGEIMLNLLDLPFVEARRDGLVVHEAVRDAVAEFLRGTNPTRYRRYQRAAWRQLRTEMRDAAAPDLWRYTADMIYLIDNPVVREAFFPSDMQQLAVEPARLDDGAAIREIARRHEGPEAAKIIERWWIEQPGMFSVVRDRDGTVVGFFMLIDGEMLRQSRVRGDPVLETWARDLHDHPLPKGQVALGLRRWLDVDHGELPCASQAACWLDVKRDYMALRPALQRMYVVVHDVPTYWPVVEKLGFRPLKDGVVVLDDISYSTVVLHFGLASVDGWLATLVGGELGFNPEPALDEQARELAIQGKLVAFTPLELGVFQYLREREGHTVSRVDLLREVWGTDYTGGSNVVDAVVRTLRQKLGAAAFALETIRGSGYRLRADWRADIM